MIGDIFGIRVLEGHRPHDFVLSLFRVEGLHELGDGFEVAFAGEDDLLLGTLRSEAKDADSHQDRDRFFELLSTEGDQKLLGETPVGTDKADAFAETFGQEDLLDPLAMTE